LRALFEETERKFDKAFEELNDHSDNKESNLDDVSTIEHQGSGESNPFNKSSLSKLKLKLDELDLSMSIWGGHFLDVKDSAFNKAKRAESEFDEKKLGEKKFSLLGSKLTPFIKIVEAKLKALEAEDIFTFLIDNEPVSLAKPGSRITLKTVKERSTSIWDEGRVSRMEMNLPEEMFITRKLARHNKRQKLETIGLFLQSALQKNSKLTMEANYKDHFTFNFGSSTFVDGLTYLYFILQEMKPPSDLSELELRESLFNLKANAFQNSAKATLDKFLEIVDELRDTGVVFTERDEMMFILKAMRTVPVAKFRDYVDLVQRQDALAESVGMPVKTPTELIHLFRAEERRLVQEQQYITSNKEKQDFLALLSSLSKQTNKGKAAGSNDRAQKSEPGEKQGQNSNNDSNNRDSKSQKYAWKLKPPSNLNDANQCVKKNNGKTYHWCPHHRKEGMWCLHKPGACKSNKAEGSSSSGSANTAQATNGTNDNAKIEIDRATLALLAEGDQVGFLSRIQQDFC
jgi:hypothetical protein